MPVRRHAALAAVLAGLLAALLPFGGTAFAATAAPAAVVKPVAAVTSGPKVVIVVGAVETVTSSFRTDADSIYAEAIKYTPNVVKIYSPNATWAAVSAAAQGASIFIYLGHGYGFPSPYKPILTPSVHDGMGLNEFANQGDADKKYYGESVVSAGIRFAKNAVVILDHACYSAGSSESGNPEPTIPVAKQRVDNFASGFLRAGARAVMADASDGNVIAMIRSIFTTHQTIGTAWSTQRWAPPTFITWQPLRNPAYTASMNPDTATTGFHRSLVGNFDLTTDEVVAGGTATTVAAGPQLWSVDGATTISPNFDGDHDSLNLMARFSEAVTWTGTITNGGGATVRTLTGSGDIAPISWVPLNGSDPLPAGDYSLAIHAVDAGSLALDTTVPIHLVSLPIPGAGVPVFAPTVTTTKSSTVTYNLRFAAPVTGLSAGDFTITGTSVGCVLNTPVSTDGQTYTITLTSCGTGKVVLQLEPGTVTDGTAAGPLGLIVAHWVVVDRTAPTATTPNASLKAGVTLAGAASFWATLAWTGADAGGSGLLGYDVARSVDGGAFTTVATAVASASWTTSLTSGHAYRFEVRARDKAGNLGTWVLGPTLYPALVQQTTTSATWSGTWTTDTATADSGGSARRSDQAGASVSYAFGGRAVGVVFGACPTCGAAQVYIDGVLVGTVNTNASTATDRWVGWSRRFASWGSHTLKLVVAGTAGSPTVSVDAFEVIK